MVNEKSIGDEFVTAFDELNPLVKKRELLVFGAGNMARCLVDAFVDKGCFTRDEVVLVTKTELSASKWVEKKFERAYSINTYLKNAQTNEQGTKRIVLIGVKPQFRHDFYKLVSAKSVHFNAEIVCSILAGVTHKMLTEEVRVRNLFKPWTFYLNTYQLHHGAIVRLTPNVPCAVGSGLTLFYGPDERANSIVTKLLKATGDVAFFPESSFHAASAIAGSGPAFAFLVAEALSDGGVLAGLPRESATKIAAQMLRGAADLLLQTGKHPGQLKDEVCSPGGVTIAGIRQLEKQGVRSAFIEAVLATKEKADNLVS